MAEFEFDFDESMPTSLKTFLKQAVEVSKKSGTLSFRFSRDTIGFDTLEGGNQEINVEMALREVSPIHTLQVLGLLEIVREKNSVHDGIVVLSPLAYRWYKYHSSNCIVRFWMQHPVGLKDIMIWVSFVLSLVLTVIQILTAIKAP